MGAGEVVEEGEECREFETMNSLAEFKSHLPGLTSCKMVMMKAEPVKYDCLPEEAEMQLLLHNAGFSVLRIIDQPGIYLCDAIKIEPTMIQNKKRNRK